MTTKKIVTTKGTAVRKRHTPKDIRVFMNGQEILGHAGVTEAMAQEYVSMAPAALTYTIEDLV
jgi:hypothetical protein